jgi:hypothetical protein
MNYLDIGKKDGKVLIGGNRIGSSVRFKSQNRSWLSARLRDMNRAGL